MKQNNPLPIFTFDFKKETLIIQFPDGTIDKKETDFRGRWNAPGFNLYQIENEIAWCTFHKWGARPDKGEKHHRIRIFFKDVQKQEGKILTTFYAQEQKYRDKTTFNLNKNDIIYKNKEGKWVPLNQNSKH